jgi:hypothetical protein
MEPNAVPEHLRESARAVVEHLSVLRGGGLFLSGVDGVLLVDWLDSGVSPALIAVALERAAERRRKRRVKSRLSLASCKGEVKRLLTPGKGRVKVAPGAAQAPSTPPPQGELAQLEAQATAELDALPGGDPATVSGLAMAIVRRFHDQAWRAAEEEHHALKAMDPVHFDEAVEEAARDLLRQRFPRLSAVAVWDRLHGS